MPAQDTGQNPHVGTFLDEFDGNGFILFPFENVWNDFFLYELSHKGAETTVGVVVVGGTPVLVPTWGRLPLFLDRYRRQGMKK